MKKILSLMLVLLFSTPLFADTSKKIEMDFGTLKLYVPFQTVEGVGLWDFVHKQGLVGIETPLGAWKHFEFKTGAVTSISGKGIPFVGMDYSFTNPTENFIPLTSFHPGIFAGYDFNARPDERGRTKPWVLGLKASVEFFTIGGN